MLIDNTTTLSYMKQDMEYFYYDIVDIKCMSKSIKIFANTPESLLGHDFVRVTKYSEEMLIDIHTENLALISEAISSAKEAGIFTISLSIEKDVDISYLTKAFAMEMSDDQSQKHWGIYGAIQNVDAICENHDVIVSAPTKKDIEDISSLPNKEWAFLPQRIKFLKNLLIAKKENDLLGYLVYDSVEKNHFDIVMVYVHPNFRRIGVASTLIKAYATECMSKNGTPYYVCANSEGSANLAKSLNLREVRKEIVIYRLV